MQPDTVMTSLKTSNMKRLSIIIVTHNSETHIYDCLQSIDRYTDIAREQLEIIVVDNCSDDCEQMFARLRSKYGEQITLISNSTNTGYGHGNNVGIRAAHAPVILIMNPDVRLCMPCLNECVSAFDSDEQLLLLGMQQLRMPQKIVMSFDVTRNHNGVWAELLTVAANKCAWYIPSLMWLSGACFFLKKEPFMSIGGFDEQNFMYGEECDIHYRLKQQYGAHFRFIRHLRYLHLTGNRIPDEQYFLRLLRADIFLYGKKGYAPATIRKHYLQKARTTLLLTRVATLLGLKSKQDVETCRRAINTYKNFNIPKE